MTAEEQQPSPLPPPSPSSRKRVSLGKVIIISVCCVVAAVVALAALCVLGISDEWRPEKEDVANLYVNHSIDLPLQVYRMHVGDYPSTTEGLQALVIAPAGKADRWRGPYVVDDKPEIFLDPWGNPYQYRYPGIHNKNKPDVWSKGPDGKDGTADDIGNWPKKGVSTRGIPGFDRQ